MPDTHLSLALKARICNKQRKGVGMLNYVIKRLMDRFQHGCLSSPSCTVVFIVHMLTDRIRRGPN